MAGIVCWFVILLIVIIVVVGIILRIWSLMPQKVISNIVNTFDIIKKFDNTVAKCLLKLHATPHAATYKMFRMDELNILTVRGKVKLNDDMINELMRKRVVIVSVEDDCKYAIDVANSLSTMNMAVSLVLFDYEDTGVDEKIHVIKVSSKDLDNSMKGSLESK